MMEDKFYKLGKNKLINLSLQLFHYFGMWPKSKSTILYTVVGYIFQVSITLGWTIAKAIASVMFEKKNDLILFVPTSIYAYSNCYRGFLFMRNHKAINTSLNVISEMLLTENEYETIQKKLKIFTRISLAYITFMNLGLVSACLNPILSHGNELPIPLWLPFNDWKHNRLDYIYALLFSYAGVAAMFVLSSFTPTVVWYLILTNSIKLEILGQRLRMLGCKEENHKQNINDLLDCIRRHQDIIANIREVEAIFSGVFFFQITSSAVCICSSAYLMADPSSGDTNSLAMYVALTGIYIYEILILIYYANEIALASDKLSFHLYESNWISMSMKYRKIVIVLMENWKKPIQFVVGKVFPMRINILTSILNVAYSILNVLRK